MDSIEIINHAVEKYKPSHIFGLFSGGHDSLCACHFTAENCPDFRGVIHIHTGIGVPETREFVYETCRQRNWPLFEYEPPETYESLVIGHGFPGPAHHYKMYQRLKERCLEQVLRDTKIKKHPRAKVALISGRRRAESVRRMANCNNPIQVGPKPSGRALWVNPCIDWTSKDKWQYMNANKLKRNPVVALLCMSGECLCGAFAKPGELEVIRRHFPHVASRIDRIAKKVENAGQYCKWGQRPLKRNYSPRQLSLCFSCEEKYCGQGIS